MEPRQRSSPGYIANEHLNNEFQSDSPQPNFNVFSTWNKNWSILKVNRRNTDDIQTSNLRTPKKLDISLSLWSKSKYM